MPIIYYEYTLVVIVVGVLEYVVYTVSIRDRMKIREELVTNPNRSSPYSSSRLVLQASHLKKSSSEAGQLLSTSSREHASPELQNPQRIITLVQNT